MDTLQVLAIFAGLCCGFTISIAGIMSLITITVNRRADLWTTILLSWVTAFGITIVVAILKPI